MCQFLEHFEFNVIYFRLSTVIILLKQCFPLFLNNIKTLDPSFKADLDIWIVLGREKSYNYERLV